jgi:hypothetical protein
MATNDISRSAYYPQKRYNGVRMQQGRVLTDDDFNEQEHINHEDKRLTRRDVIGSVGSPDAGFSINGVNGTDSVDFSINAGTFYLDGLRLALAEGQTFKLQTDWLQKNDVSAPTSERRDMVYLEVWQQDVSAVEDQELYEKALGGPDTTTRRRTMFRVKLAEDVDTRNCAQAWKQVIAEIENDVGGRMQDNHALISDATLKVDYETNGDDEDLCSPSILAGYLGAENQAIRVQLVDKNFFTWGFDNGAPLYRVTLKDAASGRKTLKLLTEPKDQAHWPVAGQVVEVLPWSAVLENGEKLAEELSPGHFSILSDSYDPDSGEITLTTALLNNFDDRWKSRSDADELRKTSFGTQDLEEEYFFLRVWNRGVEDISDPIIAVGSQVKLGNTGLNITIEGNSRLPGDHWIIAARPHTPDQVVPWQLEVKRGANGYQRFYAPLAIIHWNAQGESNPVVYDCRKKFRPLTDLRSCCTYDVGDGVHSNGDFNSIEKAVKHLPEEGGCICVLPGVHHANVNVVNRHDIHITGCGDQSIVHPGTRQPDNPIFHFSSCNNIAIDHLTLMTTTGTAVEFYDEVKGGKASTGITIEHNHILALTHAVSIRVDNGKAGKNAVRIRHNNIGMWDIENGDVAIFISADDVAIEENQITVIPAPESEDPNDPRDPAGPEGQPYELCENLGGFYAHRLWMHRVVINTLLYLKRAWEYFRHIYQAKGGIQVAGGSELVRILRNRIIGGSGNGITLGDLPTEGDLGTFFKNRLFIEKMEPNHQGYLENKFSAYLYEIIIENNFIVNMGLSGIGVVAFLHTKTVGMMVAIEEVSIRENHITRCAQQIPEEKPESMLDEIGFGGIVLAACEKVIITHNKIQNNGRYAGQAICGVLILYGEKIDVSNNRILNNGPMTEALGQELERGLRGGIVVALSFQQILYDAFLGKEIFRPDGIPAVKVHDNIVTQPLGQALFLIAFGPVSIVGNQFTSQGADYRVNRFSLLAGAVLVINLGISQDFMMFMLLSSYRYMATANPKVLEKRQVGLVEHVGPDVTGAYRLLYLPGGNVLFANNQTTLDMRHKDINFAFSAQLIASLDDVAYNNNQSDVRSLFDILLTDVGILGATVRSNDNRFQEGITVTISSLFSYGFMNTAATNQATHCLFVFGGPGFTLNVANHILYKIGCPEKTIAIGDYLHVQMIAEPKS